MTFTYNAASVSGGRDLIRLLIQDTTAPGQFSDEELDLLLAQHSGDARLAAADALDAWANLYARQAIRYNVTGFGMDRTMIPDQMRLQAKQLRDEAKAIPYEFESVLDHAVTMYGEDESNYPNDDVGESPVP